MTNRPSSPKLAIALILLTAAAASAADSWPRRSGDAQNTGSAGNDPLLQVYNVKDLTTVGMIPTGIVNATPVITEDDLLIVGDWAGFVYVVDLISSVQLVKLKTDSGGSATVGGDALSHLRNEFGSYIGVQSTAALATVTTPAGEERRIYIGANSAAKTMYCLNLSKIAADRNILVDGSDGSGYLCDGPEDEQGNTPWPRSLATDGPEGNKTLNGSPLFSADHWIDSNGNDQEDPGERRDVLFTPSTGLDCANGQFWALDAYTGKLLWAFDPVVNGSGEGGTIWTTPAMSRDGKHIYLTTGDCVGQPQLGEKAEALVALNTQNGEVAWFHQRRLIDTADLDIGTGPLVADVDDFQTSCHVVVSFDKDGCVYGFPQERDIPQVGDLEFDPLRMDQQRLLYRKCFVPGSLNGGFNASNPALWGRIAMQQASGYPSGHVGADDSNAFAIDVCTGRVMWASSDVKNGRTDAAVASGMLFQLGVTKKPAVGDYPYDFVREIQVVEVDPEGLPSPLVQATVRLMNQPTLGGGGPAIVKGRIYVPTTAGIEIVGVVPDSNASPPQTNGLNIFAGPYPEPIAPGAVNGAMSVDPDNPYPLLLDSTVRRLGEYKN